MNEETRVHLNKFNIIVRVSVNFPSPDSPVASPRPRVRHRVRKSPPHPPQVRVSRCPVEDQEWGRERSQETRQGARRRLMRPMAPLPTQVLESRGAGQEQEVLPPPSLRWLV